MKKCLTLILGCMAMLLTSCQTTIEIGPGNTCNRFHFPFQVSGPTHSTVYNDSITSYIFNSKYPTIEKGNDYNLEVSFKVSPSSTNPDAKFLLAMFLSQDAYFDPANVNSLLSPSGPNYLPLWGGLSMVDTETGVYNTGETVTITAPIRIPELLDIDDAHLDLLVMLSYAEIVNEDGLISRIPIHENVKVAFSKVSLTDITCTNKPLLPLNFGKLLEDNLNWYHGNN